MAAGCRCRVEVSQNWLTVQAAFLNRGALSLSLSGGGVLITAATALHRLLGKTGATGRGRESDAGRGEGRERSGEISSIWKFEDLWMNWTMPNLTKADFILPCDGMGRDMETRINEHNCGRPVPSEVNLHRHEISAKIST